MAHDYNIRYYRPKLFKFQNKNVFFVTLLDNLKKWWLVSYIFLNNWIDIICGYTVIGIHIYLFNYSYMQTTTDIPNWCEQFAAFRSE